MPRQRLRRAPVVLATLATVLMATLPAHAAGSGPSLSRKDPKNDVEVTAQDGASHRIQARSLDILSVRATRKGKHRIVVRITTQKPVTKIAAGRNREGQLVATLCPTGRTRVCADGVLLNVPLPSSRLIAAAFTYADDGTATLCPKPVDVTGEKNVVTLVMRRSCLPDTTDVVLSAVTVLDVGSGDTKAHLQDPTKLSKVGDI